MSGNHMETLPEEPVWGWENISRILGLSDRSARRRRDEMLKSGVIGYGYRGRCKRRQIKAYPSVLKSWVLRKNAQGERV